MDVVWRLGEATAEQVASVVVWGASRFDRADDHASNGGQGLPDAGGRGQGVRLPCGRGRQKAQGSPCDPCSVGFLPDRLEDLVLRLIEDEHLSSQQLEELKQSAKSCSRPKRKKGGAS